MAFYRLNFWLCHNCFHPDTPLTPTQYLPQIPQRTLCEELASRGSLSKHAEEAQQRIRRLVGSGSRNVTVAGIEQPDLDRRGQMRYILIDWLIEVVDLKHFGHETVFLTVQLIDRFLERQAITRQDLQLIGVASMVIAARWALAQQVFST